MDSTCRLDMKDGEDRIGRPCRMMHIAIDGRDAASAANALARCFSAMRHVYRSVWLGYEEPKVKIDGTVHSFVVPLVIASDDHHEILRFADFMTKSVGKPYDLGGHRWKLHLRPRVEYYVRHRQHTTEAAQDWHVEEQDGAVNAHVISTSMNTCTAEYMVAALTANGWYEWNGTEKPPQETTNPYDSKFCHVQGDLRYVLSQVSPLVSEAVEKFKLHGRRKASAAPFRLAAKEFGETRWLEVSEPNNDGMAYSTDFVFAGTAGATGEKVYPSKARFKHIDGKWLLSADNFCLNRNGGRKVGWLDTYDGTVVRAKRHGKGC